MEARRFLSANAIINAGSQWNFSDTGDDMDFWTDEDFDPVTLKMVKEQHLAPGSPKISGGCGRLMCCLRYERSFYAESGKEFPKLGTKIEMGDGKGRVVAVDIFRRRVTLSDEEGKTMTVTLEDFKKGRITAVGTDDAASVRDDYWGDSDDGRPRDEEGNAG